MKINRVFQTPNDGHYFFGYYDKSPLSKTNTKLLACKSNFIDRMPTKDDSLEIGYFEWQKSTKFIKITETKAWNWQQGCMLQWLAPEYENKVIYNDRIDNKFVTVILDIESRKKNILPMAYYTMSSDGKFVLCIDNERHYWFRSGYSYQGIENVNKKQAIDKNDGIWYIDIRTKQIQQIITQEDLLNINYLSNMHNSIHYIEHLMINPDNHRFAFLHRWQMEDGGIYARLYTSDINGKKICLVNDSGRMSHFCWRTKNELLGYGGIENNINKVRKNKNIVKFLIKPLLPLYHKLINDKSSIRALITGDSYILFKDLSNKKTKIGKNILKEDGHPTFFPLDKNIFVSDTYQDIDSYRDLFLFNVKNNQKINIERLYSMNELDNTSLRCDLHPKWNLDGKFIAIDTTNDKRRSIYIYAVE